MKPALQADPRVPLLLSYDLAFALVDRAGTLAYASPAAARILGEPEGPSRGDPLGAWPRLTALVRTVDQTGSATAPAAVIEGRHGRCRASVHLPDLRMGHVLPLVLLHPCEIAHAPDLGGFALTPRECEVARLLATGLALKQVAGHLGVSYHTARHHAERIYSKLGVHGRVEVARLVMGAA